MSRMISDPEGAADELGYGRDDCWVEDRRKAAISRVSIF